jgi:hypothetical protein
LLSSEKERRSNGIASQNTQRKYLTIENIQKEYLPCSKKKIRAFVKKYLPTKIIGGRMYVERSALELLLQDENKLQLPLK